MSIELIGFLVNLSGWWIFLAVLGWIYGVLGGSLILSILSVAPLTKTKKKLSRRGNLFLAIIYLLPTSFLMGFYSLGVVSLLLTSPTSQETYRSVITAVFVWPIFILAWGLSLIFYSLRGIWEKLKPTKP